MIRRVWRSSGKRDTTRTDRTEGDELMITGEVGTSARSGERVRDWVAVDEADGVLDELQAWYLGKAEREGWVYTGALRQLVNRMYRDRDYLARRSR
jgi:hypothetical protein